ncbi:AraC family transcriptional regulator [Gloeocapsa sp. BRSZ]
MSTGSSQPLIHPSNLTKPEWLLNRRSLHMGSLVVEHQIESPDEIETPLLSHHVLGVLLSDIAPRQVCQFDGKEYDGAQHQGDMWLLSSGQSGFFHWESTDETLMFMIDPNFLRQIALETGCLNLTQVEILPVLHHNDPQIRAIAHLFLQEMTHGGIGSQLYQDSIANLFAIHLLRHYCAFKPKFRANKGGLSEVQLRQALDYIQAHLNEAISLDAIASAIGISRYYFCTQFKRSTGVAPYEYVLQQRVERAKQLLRRGELSIADVALKVGFADQTHFTKHFRKITGVTPAKFCCRR